MKGISMAIVGTALLVAAPIAGAQDQKINGVRAELRQGTLQISGGDQANVVALRLKSGDASVIQVDVGNDATPDFSFGRSDVEAINVKMGDGNDRAPRRSAAAMATTSYPAARVPTRASWAPATTASAGTTVMAVTWSRARTAPTRWCSTARKDSRRRT